MADVAVRVDGLSKRYALGTGAYTYGRLTESLSNALRRPFRHTERTADPEDRHIWALRGVSFQVVQGEAVGIIGRNGAGKTTLLKVLSRITDPTEGLVRIRGRVDSLLEVGVGFHSELTGRENIFLNGAILGMRRAEIVRKLDEIVAFAEVERFLDTPVKRYSSGMYVRLAFAVAAHLEPNVLLVDEVLAVGDIDFQRKCLGKMHDVAQGGRTVLFVSHQLAAVNRLCDRALWLHQGQVRALGSREEVGSAYLNFGDQAMGQRTWGGDEPMPGSQGLGLRRVTVLSDGVSGPTVDIRKLFRIEIEYELDRRHRGLRIGFTLYADDGTAVFTALDRHGLNEG